MTVAVLGTGLIGGSIGLALTKAGITVRGFDGHPAVAERACEKGEIESVARSVAEHRPPVGGVLAGLRGLNGIPDRNGRLPFRQQALGDVRVTNAPRPRAGSSAGR